MQILIYKGDSQYGAFDYFAQCLGDALKLRNHDVVIFDLNMENAMKQLSEIFITKSFDIVIGFNGIGGDMEAENKSIYDILKTYYLGIFVDHPAFVVSRLVTPMNYFLASFLDKSHVDFVQNSMPESQILKFFMPLSGTQYEDEIKTFEEYKSLKNIDILFTGSNFGKPLKKWEDNILFPSFLFDELAEKLILDDYISVEDAFNQILDKYKIAFSTISKAQISNTISMVISYVRQYKRELVMKKIFQSGLSITVYGKNWDELVEKYPNVINGGEVSLEKSMELTKKAKVIINLNTNFTNGAHDRVFTGMLNHAVVFTDKSTYYDEFYEDKIDYLTYSLNTLDEDIKKLNEYVQDDEKLFAMANKAYEITSINHSWTQRAKYLENMIILAKTLNS